MVKAYHTQMENIQKEMHNNKNENKEKHTKTSEKT